MLNIPFVSKCLPNNPRAHIRWSISQCKQQLQLQLQLQPRSAQKNPKRVAAGKLVAERTGLAREQQKKAVAEAAVIIANNKAKAPTAGPEPAPTIEDESPKSIGEKIAVSAPPNGLLLPA